MNTSRYILPLIYLVYIRYQLAETTPTRQSWVQNVTGIDLLYSPSLLTTNETTIIACILLCSATVKCKAATYNTETRTCSCLESMQIAKSETGNRLWNRWFDGFIHIEQLDWYVRMFTNISKTHAEAELFCGTLGGRLAVLDTDDKLNYVRNMSDFTSDNLFSVGATEEQTEGIYIWSSGSYVTNWFGNEPNNFHGDENCVALYDYGFVDIPCHYPLNFVCETE